MVRGRFHFTVCHPDFLYGTSSRNVDLLSPLVHAQKNRTLQVLSLPLLKIIYLLNRMSYYQLMLCIKYVIKNTQAIFLNRCKHKFENEIKQSSLY